MLPNQDSCWISWGNLGISEHDLMMKIPQDSSKTGKRNFSRSKKNGGNISNLIENWHRFASETYPEKRTCLGHVSDYELEFPRAGKRTPKKLRLLLFNIWAWKATGIRNFLKNRKHSKRTVSFFVAMLMFTGHTFGIAIAESGHLANPSPGKTHISSSPTEFTTSLRKVGESITLFQPFKNNPPPSQSLFTEDSSNGPKKLQNCQVIPLERLFFKMLFEFPTTSWCFEMCVSWGMFVWNIQIWTST